MKRLPRKLTVLGASVTLLGSAFASMLHAPPAAAAAIGGLFVPQQVRLVNTQTGLGNVSSTPLVANTWYTVNVAADAGDSASSIGAVEVTFTTLNPSANGYLQAFPGDAAPTSARLVNYDQGTRTSNSAVVATAADGTIKVLVTTSTDLVIDLQGYYGSGATAPGGFVPLDQTEIASTSDGSGGLPAHSLAAGTTTSVPVEGVGGVPATASSVMLEVTEDDAGVAAGALAIYPSGTAVPNVGLSWSNDQPAAWTIPIDTSTSSTAAILIKSGGPVDLTISVSGYFTSSSTPDAAGTFTPAELRVLDTKTAGTTLAAGEIRNVPIAGVSGIPGFSDEELDAVIINVHAVPTSAGQAGSLSAYSADNESGPPTVFFNGTSASTMVTGVLGVDGDLSVANNSSSPLDVAIDVEGWFNGQAVVQPVAPPAGTPMTAPDASPTAVSVAGEASITNTPSESDAALAADPGGAGTIPPTPPDPDPNPDANAPEQTMTLASAPDQAAPAASGWDVRQGLNYANSNRSPADPSAAKLYGHRLTTVNDSFKLIGSDDSVIWQAHLYKLFGLPSSAWIFDPEVIAQPTYRRFVVMADRGGNDWEVAVSTDSSGTDFCAWQFPATNASQNFADFPRMGASGKYLYLTINELHAQTPSTVGNRIAQINLSDLANCRSARWGTWSNVTNARTGDIAQGLVPVLEYKGNYQPYEYLVDTYYDGGTHIFLDWVRENQTGSPLYEGAASVPRYYKPHHVGFPGGALPLDGGSNNPLEAVSWAEDVITTIDSWYPYTGVNGFHAYELYANFATGAVHIDWTNGLFYGGTASVIYPTVSLDRAGDAMFTYDLAGPKYYVSMAVMPMSKYNAYGTTADLVIQRTVYVGVECGDQSCYRWGDFSSSYPAGDDKFVVSDMMSNSNAEWTSFVANQT